MEVGMIFNLSKYQEAVEFANKNKCEIKEIESKKEYVYKEVETLNEKDELIYSNVKVLEDVRYFQIVEGKKITNEDISQMRQSAYIERTDPLTLRKMRKQALGEWTSEDEKEYVAQIQAISAQIASEFPYNSEEPNL